jgi:hypothetical protein
MGLTAKYLAATAIALGLSTQPLLAQTTSTSDLPVEQTQGDVRFRTGGIGIDESTAFKNAIPRHSAALVFTSHSGGNNEYLADVPVTITDARGREVLRAAVGPYLLVDLPAGTYTATARYQEQSLTRKFTVGGRKGTRVAFDWRR